MTESVVNFQEWKVKRETSQQIASCNDHRCKCLSGTPNTKLQHLGNSSCHVDRNHWTPLSQTLSFYIISFIIIFINAILPNKSGEEQLAL
jgi:hypothetical protein